MGTNVLSPVTSFVAVIDGKDVIAEGKEPELECQVGSANDVGVCVNAQAKFMSSASKGARAEMCIIEDGMLPSSSSDWKDDDSLLEYSNGGVECFKISNQVEGTESEELIALDDNEGIEQGKKVDFQMFGMLYSTIFSRLRTRYSMAVEFVSAVDLH